MANKLVIVGAGGLGREVAEAVRAVNAVTPTWDLVGFVDDSEEAPHEVDGAPLLGPIDSLHAMPDTSVVLCTVRSDRYWSRKEIAARLNLPRERYATIVHPAAVIPPGSQVGVGSVILAGVISTTPADLGDHVVVMPGTILTHDDRVASHVTFAAGVRVAGGVVISEGAYLGVGALVRERLHIGAWALVGMGAVVTRDVPPAEVWVGSPARHRRAADVPAHILQG